ncbi:hypothetical protein [Streptosporangium saharense]|uniref:hypothetical protein n=1 Tax=Streptosporangium saharense TaxID=1706840 RepID=UPI003331FB10
MFYDPVRLGQEITDELERGGALFREPNLVVIDRVTREHMEAAIGALAESGFLLVPEPDRS